MTVIRPRSRRPWCSGVFLASATVHPTCSTIHLGLEHKLNQIAGAVADEVIVPIGKTCCGTAGDRGLLHPELVVSATRDEKAHIDAHPTEVYLSANRACEMGLRQATLGRTSPSSLLSTR